MAEKMFKLTIVTENECVKDDILEILKEADEEAMIAGPFDVKVDEIPEGWDPNK